MKIVGNPNEKPKPEERTGYYIHDNSTAYLDVKPDGVYLDVKDKDGHLVYRKGFEHVGEAFEFIEHKRGFFSKKD